MISEGKRRAYIEKAAAVRWRRVLVAGAAAGVLPYAVARLIIYLYVIVPVYLDRGAPAEGRIAEFGTFMVDWGWPAIHLLLVLLAASWVARRAGDAAILHGALVGLASVAASQLVGLYYGPLLPGEVAKFIVLGLAGGTAGGAEGRTALRGQEALYEASRGIGSARDARDVVAAIGEHLAGPEVCRILLYGGPPAGADNRDTTPEPLATWSRETSTEGAPAASEMLWLRDTEALEGEASLVLRRDDLSSEVRIAWESVGARSGLLLPLVAAGEERVGLLLVLFRRGSGPSGSTARAYRAVSAQAALALRLIEQARKAAVLEERQRMAHEIHDTLAQGFTSIVMTLEAAEGALARSPERARSRLEEARRTARENVAEARRLVEALRPGPLEDTPLPEALSALARRWSEETGLPAEAAVEGERRPLPPEVESALLRAAQEALSNVRKHARAGRAMVTLSYAGDRVLLDVMDDGAGFDPDDAYPVERDAEGGFGLPAMRERVRALGGELHVDSAPGEGTALTLELPLSPAGDRRAAVAWRAGEEG